MSAKIPSPQPFCTPSAPPPTPANEEPIPLSTLPNRSTSSNQRTSDQRQKISALRHQIASLDTLISHATNSPPNLPAIYHLSEPALLREQGLTSFVESRRRWNRQRQFILPLPLPLPLPSHKPSSPRAADSTADRNNDTGTGSSDQSRRVTGRGAGVVETQGLNEVLWLPSAQEMEIWALQEGIERLEDCVVGMMRRLSDLWAGDDGSEVCASDWEVLGFATRLLGAGEGSSLPFGFCLRRAEGGKMKARMNGVAAEGKDEGNETDNQKVERLEIEEETEEEKKEKGTKLAWMTQQQMEQTLMEREVADEVSREPKQDSVVSRRTSSLSSQGAVKKTKLVPLDQDFLLRLKNHLESPQLLVPLQGRGHRSVARPSDDTAGAKSGRLPPGTFVTVPMSPSMRFWGW